MHLVSKLCLDPDSKNPDQMKLIQTWFQNHSNIIYHPIEIIIKSILKYNDTITDVISIYENVYYFLILKLIINLEILRRNYKH